MGWGCYRHEVDCDSDNWKAQIDKLLPDGASHGKPFNWGRDGQVCPFCWEEQEKIVKIYSTALSDILRNPEGAAPIACVAFKDAESISLHPMESEPQQKATKKS